MAEDGVVQIAAICGSLRQASWNHGLLRALQEIADERGTIAITLVEGIGNLPLLNTDLLATGFPEEVLRVKSQVEAADGVLFGVAEYSYGMSGALKNAFDWLGLPDPSVGSLRFRPAAMVGASVGVLGTWRAQADVHKSLQYSDCPVMTRPEVLIASASTKFDEAGNLTDESVRTLLRRFLDDYEEFVRTTLSRNLSGLGREYIR